MAMTEGDNRNVMAAQLATEALDVRQVIAKINDPVRAEAYADLGIATLCRTNLMVDAINDYLGLPTPSRPGVLSPDRAATPAASTTTSAAAGAAGGTPMSAERRHRPRRRSASRRPAATSRTED